ncbi:IclR family transcriptional regulator [Variovorax sp. OV329]|uniref:IclR family transcriptional regulator n=1 Tax=Variovorax sp. OV329 TaxID=1882825 RepID=UPI0008F02204|nr:helix-turn-helix domain-containing protein [Variovorax sp. OV329]SFN56291.1 transcriptional regulator, IclR family [Variovorax sp. OV329]
MTRSASDDQGKHASARALDAEKPGRSPANRSLERGTEILRAFRPGSTLLGNAELAERTGLSKATVSRLTQTLVGAGMLQPDPPSRAFRLAPSVLSLAHAMRAGSTVLAAAAPLMRTTAEGHRINVGLAAPDRDEMVYLESIRYNRRPSLRSVVSGQRVPMELTSLGRAHLHAAPEARRKALLEHFRRLRGAQWKTLGLEISAALRSMDSTGWCAASWQHEVVAVATSLTVHGSHYALNLSVSTVEDFDLTVSNLAPTLMSLRERILQEIERNEID